MYPWINPWLEMMLRSPFSGDVSQAIAPVTRWWSPQIELNFAGHRGIEQDVVGNVASYGKQIGILSEAILEVAAGKPGAAVQRLEQLSGDIEKVKQRYTATETTLLKQQLMNLKQRDKHAFEQLLSSLQQD